ncbi:MAG: hypothetical protein FJ387_25435 [Verrucomicrobia bacterium]|nr:hypothetical protein [Verrucomicrobiota bacterium]
MSVTYCYWSVADGDYAEMLKTCVRSARRALVFRDFHLWTDRNIEGATCHPAGEFDKGCYLFKLEFLRQHVSKLKYDYFVWLDADTYFVRPPGDLLRVLHGAPLHASLESDACARHNVRTSWWDCPLETYARFMRAGGVRSAAVFNVNAGFWIVQRDVIDTFCTLCFDFWEFCRKHGVTFTEEAPLAYATHMLCGNPYLHTLRTTWDLWASDWTGFFRDQLPDGDPWWFEDYFTGEKFPVNPAIVHAMRSKQALVAAAQRRAAAGTATSPIASARAQPAGSA